MDAPWLALHVFYAGDHDRLLLDAIRPALTQLRKNKLIARYFFIRYWNGGPHVRLRVQCRESIERVETQLRQPIEAFLRTESAGPPDPARYEIEAARIREVEERLGAAAVGAVEPIEPLQPADSVQTRPYHFDVRRYGGRRDVRRARSRLGVD